MEESASSSSAFSRIIEDFPDPILDNVLEYVMKNTLYYREAGSFVMNAELQRWGFSEDIGRAVMVVMHSNRVMYSYVNREILDLVGAYLFGYSSESNLPTFDNKIHNYGHLLILGDQRQCLNYLALICEIILTLSTEGLKCLIRRVISIAKVTLRRYAPTNHYYMSLDSAAKHVLFEINQLPLRRNESVGFRRNESADLRRIETLDLRRNEAVDLRRNEPVDLRRNEPVDLGRNEPVDLGRNDPVDLGRNESGDPSPKEI